MRILQIIFCAGLVIGHLAAFESRKHLKLPYVVRLSECKNSDKENAEPIHDFSAIYIIMRVIGSFETPDAATGSRIKICFWGGGIVEVVSLSECVLGKSLWLWRKRALAGKRVANDGFIFWGRAYQQGYALPHSQLHRLLG